LVFEFTHQLQKNDIETGRGGWAALPGSRRTMRRVFSKSLAAAPFEVGYMLFYAKPGLHLK